ncbi:MAG TPA: prepilin peptidase [Polyangia bacterium]|jgi:leader peptidase (prepilin peptidase)/N-methyltransferase|nr:prepilin peptidase [Polyangia bacterium]
MLPAADMADSPLAVLVRPPIGWILALVWGALWGSFCNVAIYRIGRIAQEEDAWWEAQPEDAPGSFLTLERAHLGWVWRALRSLVDPARSHCPRCGALIRARDNLPLAGWLLLRGRCRDCHAPISPRYPLIEAGAAALAAAVYLRFVALAPAEPIIQVSRFFVYFGFAAVLLVLTAIDLETLLLPDAITYPAIPAFFLAGRCLPDVSTGDAALGLGLGYAGLQGLALGWRLATGRDALGGGDAKLLALVGGLLGWRALPWTLLGGAILGLVIALPLLAWQRWRGEQHEGQALTQIPVPFGPALATAALAYLFFGRALNEFFFAGLGAG